MPDSGKILVSINGELTDSAAIKAVSDAVMYGRGVFTTLAIAGGRPTLWNSHSARLRQDCRLLSTTLPDEERVFGWLTRLIQTAGLDRGRARISVLDTRNPRIWPVDRSDDRSVVMISVAEPRAVPDRLRLTLSRFPVNSGSPLAAVKSCNYLESLLSLEEAHAAGFDEALRLNDRGEVASASCANVFWARSGRLFTPALETGCLAGTTRNVILEKLGAAEVTASVDDLEDADELFLTSAGLGAVGAVFGGSGRPGSICDAAREAVNDAFLKGIQ